jgi:hypothetical protein
VSFAVPLTDFLQEQRTNINDRLTELRPLVKEYDRLVQADAALDGIPRSTGKRASAAKPSNGRRRRGPGRPRGSRNATPPAARTARSAKATRTKTAGARGRRRGSGQRGAEALAIIKEQPGIAIPEIADKMGIKHNYLYRVLPGLEQEGKITKDGRGWHPKAASKAAA